ncbi:hypothetical protein BY458DRAFT_356078 [Sporodiniella umbellata]|nr:hypothetical protein BY458DRAFT_356078 [Sporodiniella umbellata]
MYIDKENDHNDVARKGVEFSELKIKALLCQAIDETAKVPILNSQTYSQYSKKK